MNRRICKWALFLLILLPSFSNMTAQQPGRTESNVPPMPAEIPASAARYSVLIMGSLAGQQATWTTSDGRQHAFFQFNDRGRGPKTTSVIRLDAKGIPVAESIAGNDYLKSKVHEEFSIEGRTAKWANDAEHGEKKIPGPAFYIAMNGAPSEIALLAHAALVNGGSIALLPEGEARVQRVAEQNVETGGKKQHVALYSITGLDFSPSYVWLDDRGQFFAAGGGWFVIVPEGWEAVGKELEKVQEKAVQARAAEVAKKLAYRPSHAVVFAHANVFDASAAAILPDQNVVIVGNHIQAVGPAAAVAAPADAEIVDATGKTLLPGLWDMHAHVGDNDGLLNLAAGVTTVRDLANDTDKLLARRKRIEDGTEIGTRIIIAGIIDGRGPYQGPTKVLVSTEQEARAAVDNYVRLGYVQIKIYSSVSPELVPPIIDEAHKNGLRVSGHIPAFMTASQCVKLGYDEIQHVNFLVLNFMPDVKETRTPARFTEPAKRAADLDLNSPEVQAFIKLLQEHHTTLDPTMTAFEEMIIARPGEVSPGFKPVANRLPPQVRRGLLSGGLTPPEGMDARYRQSFAKMVDLVGVLYRAGIPIEAGTDSMAGFALQRELELDTQAGIPAPKVLQLATLGAAKIMKRDTELGSITSGKLADLVLVDGNPATNISDVRKTSLTMKDGVIYKPAELYSELGIVP
ncbi:MAG: amidohydrolase family protein [Terriglobales bacterium]